MTAIRTSQQNAFEGTLTGEMGPNDLTATVDGVGILTTPCYLVVEMDSDSQREYIYFDGTFTGTTFVTTNISKRYLAGSAAGSNLTHHGSLQGLANDDHTQYPLADGTRGFTAAVEVGEPVVGTDASTKAYVDAQVAGGVPAGLISAYGGSSAPGGYLLCDGAEISRATYNDLFLVISTAYGVGNGTTTFDLPDLRQRFPLGKAVSGTGGTLGDTGGSIDPTINIAHTHALGSHTHDIGHSHANTIATAVGGDHTHTMGTHTHTADHNHGAVTSGGGSAHSHSGPSHTHSFSDTSGGPSSTSSPYNKSGVSVVGSSTHTHYVSGTTGSGGTGSTGSDSSHTHSVDLLNKVVTTSAKDPGDTNTSATHSHSVTGGVTDKTGNSGSASGTSDSSLSATEAVPNAPFLTVNYLIKT